MEVITDADYAHATRICKDLKNIYIYRYAKANNKHMKYYDKNKELSHL